MPKPSSPSPTPAATDADSSPAAALSARGSASLDLSPSAACPAEAASAAAAAGSSDVASPSPLASLAMAAQAPAASDAEPVTPRFAARGQQDAAAPAGVHDAPASQHATTAASTPVSPAMGQPSSLQVPASAAQAAASLLEQHPEPSGCTHQAAKRSAAEAAAAVPDAQDRLTVQGAGTSAGVTPAPMQQQQSSQAHARSCYVWDWRRVMRTETSLQRWRAVCDALFGIEVLALALFAVHVVYPIF